MRGVQDHQLVDHLLDHDFSLVDHDGRPTRWAVFGPRALNHDPAWWQERGLNSLSILSYLRVAEHVSGDTRYAAIADRDSGSLAAAIAADKAAYRGELLQHGAGGRVNPARFFDALRERLLASLEELEQRGAES